LSIITTDQKTVVVGLGKTGYSAIAFFVARGINVVAMDTREQTPFSELIKKEFPQVTLYLGGLVQHVLTSASKIVVSPGLPLSTPEIQMAIQNGVPVVGDIQVFADYARAPVIAITGSNAKSTVTTLVGLMAQDAGVNVAIGGNLGTPALDLIADGIELYVMELSSFQLETTPALKAKVATVLNVSPDHLDRYDSYLHYHQAKHKIFNGCEKVVVNRDDALSAPMLKPGVKVSSFGLSKPDLKQFGIVKQDSKEYLAKFNDVLLDTSSLKIKGSHNRSNALAALALGEAVGLDIASMLVTLQNFSGLEHRCQWLKSHNGVDYFNDSKGTNVGATIAALEGLGPDTQGSIILMAGGVAKDADFSLMKAAVKLHVKTLVLYGQDKLSLAQALEGTADIKFATSFDEAFKLSNDVAQPGDAVVLSPACASFDMFKSFEHRGEYFTGLVDAL
jgi:UDP-N-acetylmuramoylalanine--D-glutamate ligase